METNTIKPEEPVKHDEDVAFERDKESAIVPLTDSDEQPAKTPESPLQPKEDTMGTSDFPALSEEEKQPKLTDESQP